MEGRALDASPARFAAVLEVACRADQAEACRVLAMARRDSPAFHDEPTITRARLQKGCDLGDGVACVNQIDPAKGGVDPKARATVEKDCQAGNGKSCVAAGMLAQLVDHDPVAPKRWNKLALDAMEAACFAGDTASCDLAAGFAPVSGLRLEPLRYRLWLETGCRGEAVDTCKALASSSSSLSLTQRRALLQLACDAQRSDACFALHTPPFALPDEPAAARDAALAHALRVAAAQCDLGDGTACAALADKLSLPFVPEAEQRRLSDHLEPACRDNLIVCVSLASSLRRGNVALRDPARIAKLEAEACRRGYPFTCRDPLTVLGVYPPLHASFFDAKHGLEWAPLDRHELTLDEAQKHCAALPAEKGEAFRLPSRAELATLARGNETKLRVFVRVYLPHTGALFSSDVDAAGVRLRLDASSGDLFASDRPEGLAGCVRKRDEKTIAGRPSVRFAKLGEGVGYVLIDEKGKLTGRPRPLAEGGLDALIARVGNGPFDAEVAADADWRAVSTFVAEAEKRRSRVGVIVVRDEATAPK